MFRYLLLVVAVVAGFMATPPAETPPVQSPEVATLSHDEIATWFNFTTTLSSGTAVFKLESAGGISFGGHYRFTKAPSGNHPIALTFVDHARQPHWIETGFDGFDQRFWGEGDAVVYASAGPAGIRSPAVAEDARRDNLSSTGWGGRFDAHEGLLVLAWADQPGPLHMSLHFRNATIVAPLSETAGAQHREIHNFTGLASAGIAPAGKIHIAGKETFTPEPDHRLFVYVRYVRGDAVGQGQLEVTGDAGRVVASLDALQDSNNRCICFTEGHIIGAFDEDATLQLQYAGEGRTMVYTLVANLPASERLHGLAIAHDAHVPP